MHAHKRTVRTAALTAIFGLTMTAGVYGVPEVLDLTPTAAAQEGGEDNGDAPDPGESDGDGSGGDEGEGTGASAEQAATIDFDKPGSITVHKRAGEKTDQRADGNTLDNPPGTPLEGAEFRLILIKAYKTADDVAEGQQLTLEEALAQKVGKPVTDIVTDADGVASFEGLELGRYLVEELSAPAGHVPGAPFLVSVPMTNPATQSGWNYDVHVYPKNTENKAEKAVVDVGQHTGDEITYTITSDIPTPSENGLSKYAVADDYDGTMVEIDPATVTAALSDGTELTPGGDFTSEIIDGSVIRVTFTEAGLDKLTANADKKVVTTIPATVLEIDGDENVPSGDATGGVVVPNNATVTSNEGSGGRDGSTTTNTVETYFGKLRVEKAAEDGAALDGATFELYDCASKDQLGGKITVADQDTWTTGDDGSLTINALHVTDYADDAPAGPAKYCLVEVEAPEGYELLAEPVEVDFTRQAIGETGGEESADDTVTLVKDITNVKSTAPSLPLTGGMGIGIIAALGALIIGAGAWLAKRNGSKA